MNIGQGGGVAEWVQVANQNGGQEDMFKFSNKTLYQSLRYMAACKDSLRTVCLIS